MNEKWLVMASKEPNIVIIGAGSVSFGLENLTGIMSQSVLKNAILNLVDINCDNLEIITSLARLINSEFGSNIEINSSTERKEFLPDADFVILSVAVDREDTWMVDNEIAKKYGIWHYAENGGPGSFSHTARGLAFIMPILNDIHDLAPDSLLVNFTNPVPRIGYAAEHVGLKHVGLCHQIWHGYGILGRYLAADLGITSHLDYEVRWTDESSEILNMFTVEAAGEYDIKAAGLNHFTWMIDVRRRDTWEDMYPLIRQEAKNVNPGFEPLTQRLFEVFDLLPVPGDCHLTEYLPYTVKKSNWDKYAIQLYDLTRHERKRKEMWERIRGIVTGQREFDLQPNPAERADWIIAEIFSNENAYESAVNIVNKGSINNLPDDAIVEVPATVSSHGISGMRMGNLPEAIAALCNREISIAKLMTLSAIKGDRNAAIKAFALDPMVNDIDVAEKLVDDYLSAHRKYLPQYFN